MDGVRNGGKQKQKEKNEQVINIREKQLKDKI